MGLLRNTKLCPTENRYLESFSKMDIKPVTRNLGRIIAATWDNWTDKIMAIVSF